MRTIDELLAIDPESPAGPRGINDGDGACTDGEPCPDCSAAPGEPHDPGCDWERCPLCHTQRLGCGCDSEQAMEMLPEFHAALAAAQAQLAEARTLAEKQAGRIAELERLLTEEEQEVNASRNEGADVANEALDQGRAEAKKLTARTERAERALAEAMGLLRCCLEEMQQTAVSAYRGKWHGGPDPVGPAEAFLARHAMPRSAPGEQQAEPE